MVSFGQWMMKPKIHCRDIQAFYIVSRFYQNLTEVKIRSIFLTFNYFHVRLQNFLCFPDISLYLHHIFEIHHSFWIKLSYLCVNRRCVLIKQLHFWSKLVKVSLNLINPFFCHETLGLALMLPGKKKEAYLKLVDITTNSVVLKD